MQALEKSLQSLLSSLPHPLDKPTLDALVSKTLQETDSTPSTDLRKIQWEFVIKDEIFKLAATEGTALKDSRNKYYEEMQNRLDVALTFTEYDACESAFPFTILYDLLETQTVATCSQIFSWIELRASRLTAGMVPQKGKALVLLRTLNDLLRRLSKMGGTTNFCGRILTFLSSVFPLSERSGVNLRGEYGPVWEGPGIKKEEDKVKMETSDKGEAEGEKKEEVKEKAAGEEDKMEVDEVKPEEKEDSEAKKRAQKEDFYNTFWFLQLPFSRPLLFSESGAFAQFKGAVDKVLPVIKEANAKERALMGSKAGAHTTGSLKRKREPEVMEDNAGKDYFFAKYLTSPELLDLEIADTHFRRQFLLQLLILLSHLLTFTKSAKATWSTQRNRSLQIDFTLEGDDAQWVQETVTKATEELRQTAPNGRAFADTVHVILEREKNWIRWKNELCLPFDKPPWSEEVEVDGVKRKVGLEEATREARKRMRVDPDPWPYELGSAPLTEIWALGYRDLSDLEHPFQPGDVKDFVKKVKQEDARIEVRKKQLTMAAERMAKARAKAAAAKEAAASPAPASTPPVSQEASSTQPSSAVPSRVHTPSAPLHPSLPAKPGTVPPSTTEILAPKPEAARVSTPVPPAAPESAHALPSDEIILQHEENKHRWSWLALRAARDQYLQHFGKIGTGDIVLLAQEIEKEKREREEKEREERERAAAATYRVLVTGGAGYIASHVIYALQETRRYKVISVDNYHNSNPKALVSVAELARAALPASASAQDKESAEIDAYAVDLTKPDDVRAVFERYGKGGIWGVIHIAAYKAVGESTQIPLTYYANNVGATITLLQIMKEFECYRVVYSSSATVYGTPPVIPIPETTRLEAQSPYGNTKVMCETIIDDLCSAEPQTWRALSLRYFNPAGAHPSGLIGEDPRGRPGNLLPLLAQIAVGRIKDKLQVFGNDYPTPDGTCVRDYLHVLDLAKGHLLALDALAPGSKVFDNCPTEARYKAYNLGKGKGMSVLQIIEAMRKATGFDYQYDIVGRRKGDVPDLTADPALAQKELGFTAPQTLETMCRDLWNWQSKNPNGYDGSD
ncbi:UDP-glucose 4-epimerase [Laetiporus sulphureus 93-53]|uniref:UDP-glucose 4-epimerase n=1 Tax=Laetiporus sulphureus 93-53 TaxID=1314785 RepID=A0A165FDN5_9APHY|nr:UDP-glucose 4-epimerase [Laetiporus sulphureus 93-53]KZT08810.1 UDP-glucose 4-epimerase [Laetiporus sulphureus 93-53]